MKMAIKGGPLPLATWPALQDDRSHFAENSQQYVVVDTGVIRTKKNGRRGGGGYDRGYDN